MPICKLCNNDTTLIKAHIIPEFMYTNLYENGQLRLTSIDELRSGNPKIGTKVNMTRIFYVLVVMALLLGNTNHMLVKLYTENQDLSLTSNQAIYFSTL